MKKATHVKSAEEYVNDVISGKITSGKWVILACERHRRDMANSITPGFRYRFDKDLAERACKFVELLTHTKGEWARRPLKLEGWQRFIVASIFGWVDKKTGYRRFRKARLYVPRKNGKSIFGAALGLYMFRFDGSRARKSIAAQRRKSRRLRYSSPPGKCVSTLRNSSRLEKSGQCGIAREWRRQQVRADHRQAW